METRQDDTSDRGVNRSAIGRGSDTAVTSWDICDSTGQSGRYTHDHVLALQPRIRCNQQKIQSVRQMPRAAATAEAVHPQAGSAASD